MINGGAGVFINVVLSLILSKYIGVFGIAVADSVSYIVLVIMSYKSVCKILPDISSVFTSKDFAIISISTITIFICGFILNIVLKDIHFFFRLVVSGLIIFGGYYILMILFQHESISYIKGFIRRSGEKNK